MFVATMPEVAMDALPLILLFSREHAVDSRDTSEVTKYVRAGLAANPEATHAILVMNQHGGLGHYPCGELEAGLMLLQAYRELAPEVPRIHADPKVLASITRAVDLLKEPSLGNA